MIELLLAGVLGPIILIKMTRTMWSFMTGLI